MAEEKITVDWCIANSKNEQSLLTLPEQNFKMVELSSSKATETLLERCLQQTQIILRYLLGILNKLFLLLYSVNK